MFIYCDLLGKSLFLQHYPGLQYGTVNKMKIGHRKKYQWSIFRTKKKIVEPLLPVNPVKQKLLLFCETDAAKQIEVSHQNAISSQHRCNYQ